MCVLTYIPTANRGFILTSNRDESVLRTPAKPPQKYAIHGHSIFFPQDPQSNGTWIASDGVFTICLLNGGLEKHIPAPPYRHSRGQIILDFYKYYNVNQFIQEYSLEGIEPFTLVIIHNDSSLTINELKWTGSELVTREYEPNEAHIWSSVTLYSPDIIQKRTQWFTDFLANNQPISTESMITFHHTGGEGDVANDIKMNRNDSLKTISITQFEVSDENFLIRYEDLFTNKTYHYRVFMEYIQQ
jgi:hypothetical protein